MTTQQATLSELRVKQKANVNRHAFFDGTPQLDTLPPRLKAMKRYMPWRRQDAEKRVNKIPCDVATGHPCSAHDPENWHSLPVAVAAMERHGLTGIGVFPGDGVIALDIDRCVNPTLAGAISAQALEIVQSLPPGYWEESPSGEGLRGWFRWTGEPLPTLKKGSIEFHFGNGGNFCTVTGKRCAFSTEDLTDATDAITALYQELSALQKVRQTGQTQGEQRREPCASFVALSDTDVLLIGRRMAGREGEVFRTLFDAGDCSAFPSRSEAHIRLLGQLAYLTGRDADRMRRLWELSKIWHDTCESDHYVDKTISTAIANCGNVYDPTFRSASSRRSMTPQPKPSAAPVVVDSTCESVNADKNATTDNNATDEKSGENEIENTPTSGYSDALDTYLLHELKGLPVTLDGGIIRVGKNASDKHIRQIISRLFSVGNVSTIRSKWHIGRIYSQIGEDYGARRDWLILNFASEDYRKQIEGCAGVGGKFSLDMIKQAELQGMCWSALVELSAKCFTHQDRSDAMNKRATVARIRAMKQVLRDGEVRAPSLSALAKRAAMLGGGEEAIEKARQLLIDFIERAEDQRAKNQETAAQDAKNAPSCVCHTTSDFPETESEPNNTPTSDHFEKENGEISFVDTDDFSFDGLEAPPDEDEFAPVEFSLRKENEPESVAVHLDWPEPDIPADIPDVRGVTLETEDDEEDTAPSVASASKSCIVCNAAPRLGTSASPFMCATCHAEREKVDAAYFAEHPTIPTTRKARRAPPRSVPPDTYVMAGGGA